MATTPVDRHYRRYDGAVHPLNEAHYFVQKSEATSAYVAGLVVIVGPAGRDINLSPLRCQPDVRFFSTPEELAEALQMAGQRTATNPDRKDSFFLNPELPRWKRLLDRG